MLVTRTRERAAGLVDALQAERAEAVVVPLLTTTALADPEAVRESFHRTLDSPDAWAVFTSATAVRLTLNAVEPELFETVNVAAVGEETAATLHARGVRAELTGDRGAAELGAAIRERAGAGAAVWFPAAEDASPALEDALRDACVVERLALYRTDMPADAPRRMAAALRRPVDAVTLTSGSAVRHLLIALGDVPLHAAGIAACLGATAADAARERGFAEVVVPRWPTVAELVTALAERLGPAQPLR